VLTRLAQLVPLDPASPLFGSLKHPGRLMEERELHTLWQRTMRRPQGSAAAPGDSPALLYLEPAVPRRPLLYVAQQSGHSARNARPAGTSRW
jgi:hypothetical protein